jgi:hypothetical protein
MAGVAEAGDRLGASVTSYSTTTVRALAGAPGEDIGSLRDAGMVQRVNGPGGWSQNSPGIPGTAEAGDRLGASVAAGLIGAPGEDRARGVVIAGLPIFGDTPVLFFGSGPVGARYGAAVAP